MVRPGEGAGVTAGAHGPSSRKTQVCSKLRARGGDYFSFTKAWENVWANTSPGFAGTDHFW